VAQSYVDREYFLCAKTNENNFIQLLIFLSVGLWLSTWELKKNRNMKLSGNFQPLLLECTLIISPIFPCSPSHNVLKNKVVKTTTSKSLWTCYANHAPIHFKTIFIDFFSISRLNISRSLCDVSQFIAMFPIQQMNHVGHYWKIHWINAGEQGLK